MGSDARVSRALGGPRPPSPAGPVSMRRADCVKRLVFRWRRRDAASARSRCPLPAGACRPNERRSGSAFPLGLAVRARNTSAGWRRAAAPPNQIEHREHPHPQRCEIRVVAEHMIGPRPLAVKGPLRPLPPLEFGLVPAPRGPKPRKADLPRGVDEHHKVALPVEARLEQQRRVDHPRRHLAGGGEERRPPPRHERMQQRLEAMALRGIGEDDRRHRPAVHLAVSPDRPIAPPGPQRLADRRLGEGLPHRRIGVGDHAAGLPEDPRDGALAGADRAGEADRRHTTRRRRRGLIHRRDPCGTRWCPRGRP